MKLKIIFTSILIVGSAFATPVLQMNNAFNALMELMPFLMNEPQFKEKSHEETIKTNLKQLSSAFKLASHDTLIKHDLFAPSYSLITDNISDTSKAFEAGRKDFSLWLLKETVTLCMDCHGRLPMSVTSSFQNGELMVDTRKIKDPYQVGLSFMIVRRFVDAKHYFTRDIQDKIISKKTQHMLLPFQQILMIETKIKKDPAGMIAIIDGHIAKKNLPHSVSAELESWKKRLNLWKEDVAITKGISTESELKQFIKRRLTPIRSKNSFNDAFKVDLLLGAGILSNYFFENQTSPSAPELSFWMGWIEKRLKKENFLSSGDLFLKQCIKKYPHHPMAADCLEEYKESVEFDFTGSGGTSIPAEIQKELHLYEGMIKSKKKGKGP
jgi:hypothetical protein